MKLETLLCWFILLATTFGLKAQDPFYINYGPDDGLPSSEVYFAHVDTSGLIWLTTDRGVSTYDGYTFKTYTTQDGLSHNTNFRIFSDPQHRLWFSAWDGSVSRYADGQFTPFPLTKDSIYTTLSGYVNQFWFDENDGVYLGKEELDVDAQLFYLNTRSRSLSVSSLPELKSNLRSQRQEEDCLLKIGGKPLIQTDCDQFPRSIVLDTVSQRWLACFENKRVKTFHCEGPPIYASHLLQRVHTIFLDPHRNLWLCTPKGLLRFKDADLNSEPRHYFTGFDVTCILMDREGSYWMTTREKGVYWIPSFEPECLLQPERISAANRVLSIGRFSQHLVMGTVKNGLIPLGSNFQLLPQGEHLKEINEITRMYPHENRLHFWPSGNLEEQEGNLKLNLFAKDQRIRYALFTRVLKNDLVIKSKRFGYYVYSNKNYPEAYSNPVLFEPTRKSLNVRLSCVEELNDTVWMGGLDGLYRVPLVEVASRSPDKDTAAIFDSRITDLFPVNSSALWVATLGNGLVYKSGNQLSNITVEDGLSSNLVNRIYLENDSTLWVGSINGLDKVIYQIQESKVDIRSITSFSTADGLSSNFINDLTMWKDHLVLATDHGVCHFPTQAIQENKIPPLIYLKEVLVGNRSILDSTNLRLAYNDNDLFFQYLGLSFKKPLNKSFYRYRLLHEDLQSDWYYTNNRSVRFQDLAPGNYIFEVEAQNKNGYWSTNGVRYAFGIKAHFSEQLWFRSSAIIFVIALLLLGFRWRTQRIKWREKQKRRLNEAELQLLRNQMNPHFIFNSLNSIQSLVFHQDIKKANYYLSKFSRLIRSSLEYSRMEYISIDLEVQFLRSYLELEKLRFEDRFRVVIEVDEDIPVHHFLMPPLLLQPVIENSVKHAFKNNGHQGQLEIHIQTGGQEGQIKVIIDDNGPGLGRRPRVASKHQSMGLSIVRNRIKLLNSVPNATPAHFSITNRYDSQGQISGTRAQFILPIKIKKYD